MKKETKNRTKRAEPRQHVIKASLSPAGKRALDIVAHELGMPLQELNGRLLLWFQGQNRLLQLVILGLIPDTNVADVLGLVGAHYMSQDANEAPPLTPADAKRIVRRVAEKAVSPAVANSEQARRQAGS